MKNIKCVLFDCMETIIDMKELPTPKDYALWTFNGSGAEKHWSCFDEFYDSYRYIQNKIASTLPEYKEYDLLERLKLILEMKLSNNGNDNINKILQLLLINYWNNYKSRTYIKDDVKFILPYLKNKYKLGVISNFTVSGGIEELLKHNNIFHYFDCIITSVNEGWRKPHPQIYTSAINKLKLLPQDIVLIGDNYICDYEGAKKAGLNTILLDRNDKYQITDKISNFYELQQIL